MAVLDRPEPGWMRPSCGSCSVSRPALTVTAPAALPLPQS
jgi:hypothetical protein